MLRAHREKLLKAIIGFGLVAFKTERELKRTQATRELSVSEDDRLKAAIKAANYAERRRSEFASHGVVGAGQDFAKSPWWPDASETARILMKVMAHAAKAKLDLHRFDPDSLDLAKVNIAKHKIRDMNPDHFVK